MPLEPSGLFSGVFSSQKPSGSVRSSLRVSAESDSPCGSFLSRCRSQLRSSLSTFLAAFQWDAASRADYQRSASVALDGVNNFAEHPQQVVDIPLKHLNCGLLLDEQFGKIVNPYSYTDYSYTDSSLCLKFYVQPEFPANYATLVAGFVRDAAPQTLLKRRIFDRHFQGGAQATLDTESPLE